MLRLIGLIVVVLLVLSLAHGERSGGALDGNARADTLVDALTGRLADGVRVLGDSLFGPGPALRLPSPRGLPEEFDSAVRGADSRSRRALASMVLRACPSLGLNCQPATARLPEDGSAPDRRSGLTDPR